MTRNEKAAVERLLRAGRRLLRKGLHHDACDAFGRVLLKDPTRGAARRGIESARRLEGEEWRAHEINRHAARVPQSQLRPSRPADVTTGPVDDEARCSRAERANGARWNPELSPAEHSSACAPETMRRDGMINSRRAFVVFSVVALSLLLAITATRWEGFVKTLVQTPSPLARESLTTSFSPSRSRGQRAIHEAVLLIERGDVSSALAVLDAIPHADPAYPFSRHLYRRLTPPRSEP